MKQFINVNIKIMGKTKYQEARSTAVKEIVVELNAQGKTFINCSLRQWIMFYLYEECSLSEQEIIKDFINNNLK